MQCVRGAPYWRACFGVATAGASFASSTTAKAGRCTSAMVQGIAEPIAAYHSAANTGMMRLASSFAKPLSHWRSGRPSARYAIEQH